MTKEIETREQREKRELDEELDGHWNKRFPRAIHRKSRALLQPSKIHRGGSPRRRLRCPDYECPDGPLPGSSLRRRLARTRMINVIGVVVVTKITRRSSCKIGRVPAAEK